MGLRNQFLAEGHFRSCEMGLGGCEMALVCQGGVSQLRKFSQRGVWGCEIISQRMAVFIAKAQFHRGSLVAAKLFRSKWPFSQGAILGYEISQTTEFFLLLVHVGFFRPAFTSFEIPLEFDHPKTYVKSK